VQGGAAALPQPDPDADRVLACADPFAGPFATAS
jgi:hypothetical protein